MSDFINQKDMLNALIGVRSDFTTLATRFKELSDRQTEITNILCGETDWQFETVKDYGAPCAFTDDDYAGMLTSAIKNRDPICQMESLVKLISKLADAIESCESKLDKINDTIKLQKKQDKDYKNNPEYKVRQNMKKKINDNAVVLVNRYYLIIKLFYKARKAWANRMAGLTEKLVFKCRANSYLMKNAIKDSVVNHGEIFDYIKSLDNQLNLHGN